MFLELTNNCLSCAIKVKELSDNTVAGQLRQAINIEKLFRNNL